MPRASRVLPLAKSIAGGNRLVSLGAKFAVARDGPANDFSPVLEWKNQIAADLEHNKRYLPGARTRGKIGVVNFELNMNHAGWVLPGTRILTADPELGRAALLLLQQSQPFPAPEHAGLRDTTFRIVVPIRFNEIPPQEEPGGLQDLERGKLLECYEADRQELEYQRRKAAYRKVEPPTAVYRMPEGCFEAKRQAAERQRREADALRLRPIAETSPPQQPSPTWAKRCGA
jgi:hypothetical protein